MFGQFVLNYLNYSEPEIGAHYEFIWQCYSSVTQSGSVTQAGNLFDPYLGDPMVADQHLVDPGYPEHFTSFHSWVEFGVKLWGNFPQSASLYVSY